MEVVTTTVTSGVVVVYSAKAMEWLMDVAQIVD
jgi:hypothetical protein